MLLRSRLVLVVALALVACSSPPSLPDGGTKACATLKDCPSGQFCVKQACVTLPCGGRCADDEVCQNEVCQPADGLSCTTDPSVCPSAFVCAPNGKCARTCTDDTECTQPGFTSCNPDTGFCGQCTFDSDCDQTSDAKFCDTSTASCVGCVDSTSCQVNGVAVGSICNPDSRKCEPGCHSVDDCPVGERCEGGSDSEVGRCVECDVATEGNDCLDPAKPRCDPQALMCVECLANADCASDQCNVTEHKCVECVQNEACLKGNVCDLDTNACVPGCLGGSGSANCPATQPVCDPNQGDRGTCVECLQDVDCPRTKVCGATTHSCVTGCNDSVTGLPSDGRCIDTTGAQPAPTDVWCDGDLGQRGQCVECRPNHDPSDCPANLICDGTTDKCRCKMTGEQPCTQNSDCGYNPATMTCYAIGAACIKAVTCAGVDNSISPVCSQAGTGLLGQQCAPGSTTSCCPAGSVTEWAIDVKGVSHKDCVPSADTCH